MSEKQKNGMKQFYSALLSLELCNKEFILLQCVCIIFFQVVDTQNHSLGSVFELNCVGSLECETLSNKVGLFYNYEAAGVESRYWPKTHSKHTALL